MCTSSTRRAKPRRRIADATIQQITEVQRPSPHYLYWPALDVDLAVESLDHPERYPLMSRVPSNRRSQPTKSRRGSRPAPARRKSPRLRR